MFKFLQTNSELAILVGLVLFAVLLGGGLISQFNNYATNSPFNNGLGICCDSGDGDKCHPIVDQTHPQVSFTSPEEGNATYGLLKSNITIADCAKHLKDSGQRGPNNEPIIIDTSNELAKDNIGELCNGQQLDIHKDTLADYRSGTKVCVFIPNDEIIYLCKFHCYPAPNGSKDCDQFSRDYYGDGTTVYDVYFRLKDTPTPGIPDVIKNCQGAVDPSENSQNQCISPTIINQNLSPTPYPSHYSLQLHTFPFAPSGAVCPQQYIRPWCKPAIYMYPKEKTDITVKIAPEGKLKTVIPQYSESGWRVTAYPDGHLIYNNQSYPYLYYAASIPDELLPKENTGYVIKYEQLSDLFDKILSQLGLNNQEINDFKAYWLKALPKSPYYFISVVPQSVLNNITPLYFSVKPDSLIRVTLNFEALNSQIDVKAPTLTKPDRKGFTVVEWGGMVKSDPNHPFTCLE